MIRVRCSSPSCSATLTLSTRPGSAWVLRMLRGAGWSARIDGDLVIAECRRCTKERP